MSNNKSRSGKPYDSSNSFVKKVASRVSGLIPRSTSWLSGWFAPTTGTEQDPSARVEDVNEAEHFEDAISVEQPPPSKRFKLNSNQQYVDTYSRCQTVEQGESSSRLASNNFIDTSAIPGPSGLGGRSGGFIASTPAVTSVQHLEPKANGDDCSESGESTSGCSSLEPQVNRGLPNAQSQSRQNDSISPRKRLLDDKFNYSYLQNSRSLFLDRTSSQSNQTVGRRNNPSFCVNTFGTPLFGERGSVNDLILNSPFYAGRTTYGGASSASYRRSLGSASLSSSPANSEKLARHTIKVKPGNTHTADDTSMSQTAKRILATLEQFSTPILDAKRIPVAQEPVLSSLGSRKRSRMDDALQALEQPRIPKRTSNKPMHWAKGAPNTSQLTIPRTPDTLLLKRKELVHEAAPTVAPVASSSADTYKLRTETDNHHSTRNMLKMKPRVDRDKEPKEPEMAQEVNLPEVRLPISSLPTFDISVPAPKPDVTKSNMPTSALPSGISSFSKSPLARTVTGSPANTPFKSGSEALSTDASFSFSSPISVTATTKVQPLTPVNNFTFSKPLPASLKFAEPSPTCVKARPKSSIDSPKQIDDFPCGLKPASELKTGSVMDILGKGTNDASKSISLSANGSVSLMDKFKPAAGTWECDKCLIRNKSDLSKCAACENPREEKTKLKAGESSETKTVSTANASQKEDSGFGTQFKMTQGMWECCACMVRNKSADTKCVSCTTPKPGATSPKATTPASSFSGWGEKFKPPSNTWECSVCMVRNGPELSACQSCTTKKPGSSTESGPPIKSSWGDQFKKPEGSWTCNDCMVSNKAADSKCVACSAKKPGAPPSPKQNLQFSFGIPAGGASATKTPAFSFGVPKNSNAGNESEKSSVSSSTGFKFGESKAEVPTTGFSFGVPPSAATTVPASTSSSALTSASLLAAGPTVSSPSTTSSSSSPIVAKASEATASQSLVLGSNAPATFSFGTPAASEEKTNPAPMFSFSKPPVSTVTSQAASSSTVSPLGGKRKFGGDTPSSSAVAMKFGIMANQTSPVSMTKPEVTTTSSASVSSTSGPISSFSSASSSASNAVAATISTTVTSSASSQNTIEVVKIPSGSPFANLVSSPSAVLPSKPALTFGLNAVAKDESVSSTWKSAAPNNTLDESKPNSENSVGTPKAGFTFGSTVSSSGMAFGSNASSGTATFSFGASTDKTTPTNKPPTFGSPASSTTLFGSAPGNVTTAPSFGSSGSSGFGTLSSSSGSTQTFPASNSISSSFSTPAPSAFPSFASSTEEKKPTFSFGPATESKKTGFDFSAPSEEKKPFSFGATDESKKTFSFTATNANATAATSSQNAFSSSVFTFGAPAPATNGPEKPSFAFGASQPPMGPTFGVFSSQQQPSTTGFSFGATAPSPSFGSSAGTTNPVPAPSPFDGAGSTAFTPSANFSAPFATNPQSSAGFNFSAPANSFSQQNLAPSFAFGNGNAPKANFSFNAQAPPDPSTGAPHRVIKRAARRRNNIR